MRRLVVLLFALGCLWSAHPAHAQAESGGAGDTPTSAVVDTIAASAGNLDCASPAIVKPNCGVAPQQAGDRGGALQYTVWGLLIVGLIVVFGVVFRSARRTNLARRAAVGDRDWS